MKNEISVLQKACHHCAARSQLNFHFKPEVRIIELILKQNVITYKIQTKKQSLSLTVQYIPNPLSQKKRKEMLPNSTISISI